MTACLFFCSFWCCCVADFFAEEIMGVWFIHRHLLKIHDVCLVHIFSVHEKTLIQALEMLSLWCNKFSNEVPKKIMDWLKVQCSLPAMFCCFVW
jgi:hypothetical protein